MAQKNQNGNRVNKSQAIRDYAIANLRAKGSEIVSALADKGIKVSPSNVYMILSKARRKARKSRQAAVAATVRTLGISSPVDAVLACRELARQLGGTKQLLALVHSLAG